MPVDVAEHIASPARVLTPERLRRSLSLDALRGLAILGMVLSGMLPYFHNTLPAWMYHAQVPPPNHVYDASLTGMTWVDLVFPLFLFALGAAIPLAVANRMEAGASRWRITVGAVGRGILLLFFALYEQHLEPGLLKDSYGDLAWLLGPLAFAILFPIFVRMPVSWPRELRFAIRLFGWVAAAIFLACVHYQDGSGFTVHRRDIIIVILANVAVSTTLIWTWFNGRISGRICIMTLIAALMLAQRFVKWGPQIMDLTFLKPLLGERLFNGTTWACLPTYQQYLLITLPGTFAGDILLTWLRPSVRRLSFSIQNSRWRELSMLRCLCLSVICVAVTVCTIVGLTLKDWTITSAMAIGLGALGFVLLYSPPARKRLRSGVGLRGQPGVSALLFRSLFTWGMLWLAMGVVLYPDQGGIRKDPATFSYLFVSAGLAHMVLIVLAVVTDALHRPGALFLLVDNGQNPMIAYVAGGMVILPLLHLIPAGDGSLLDWITALTPSPWAGFGRGVGFTLLVAFFVSGITRLKLFWRT